MFEDGWQHQSDLYCCLCGKYGTTYRRWWDDIHCLHCDGELPKEPEKPKVKAFSELTYPEKMVRVRKFKKDLMEAEETALYCTFVNERTGEVISMEQINVG